MRPTKEEYAAALKVVNAYKKEEEIEDIMEYGFEDILEILCNVIEEPAGHGAGYGFRDTTDAFEEFKKCVDKIREMDCQNL